MAASSRRGRPPYDDVLTPAEWRVVHAVKHGLSNREIARRRAVSLDAVKAHVASAILKLGLADRNALKHWHVTPRGSALKEMSMQESQATLSGTTSSSTTSSSATRSRATRSISLGALGQIARTVRDIERSAAWYRDVLGLPHLYTFGKLAFFDCGGTRLMLSESESPAEESILYWRVADIVASHAALKAGGRRVRQCAPHDSQACRRRGRVVGGFQGYRGQTLGAHFAGGTLIDRRALRRLGLLLLCTLAVGPAYPAGVDEPSAPAVLDEIVVTGERSGPGMWHVHHDGADVWLLGSLSPLPRGITWRSRQVEQVLAGASQVLVQKPFEISTPRMLWVLLTERSVVLETGGKRLKDALPAPLYERFATLRHRYTDDPGKWEHYRPIVAAALLQQAAFHQIGLSMRLDLGAAVRLLAKERHVRIEELKVAAVGDMLDALKTMPADTENTCVDASLVTMESALPRLIERAQAWVDGNIERLQNLPLPREVDACRDALDAGHAAVDVIGHIRQNWLYAIEKYLRGTGTTIAVVNLDLMLEHGGLLDELRAAGYEIEAPR
jgi:uncharacterized protein YbaP (TraB family)/DNA-binding CsgD family transcriptional regulator